MAGGSFGGSIKLTGESEYTRALKCCVQPSSCQIRECPVNKNQEKQKKHTIPKKSV